MTIAELADCVSNFNVGTSRNVQVDLSVCGWSFAEALSNALDNDYLIIASCDYRVIMAVNDVSLLFTMTAYTLLMLITSICVLVGLVVIAMQWSSISEFSELFLRWKKDKNVFFLAVFY